MKRIIATCDPHNARRHYHGEKVLEYEGITPVKWVVEEYASLEEAKKALWNFALEDCHNHDGMSHEFDENIKQDICDMAEDQDLDEEGTKELRECYASWYKGEGIYSNEFHEVVMMKGDVSYSFDTMGYCIEY